MNNALVARPNEFDDEHNYNGSDDNHKSNAYGLMIGNPKQNHS